MVFLNLPPPTLLRFVGLGLVPVSGGLSGAGSGQAAVGNNDGNYGDDDAAVVVVVVLFVHFFDTAIRPGKQTNVNLLLSLVIQVYFLALV